jgi:hypothetical protein
MAQPRLLARLEITNGLGTFDSGAPPTRSSSLAAPRIEWKVDKTLDPTPNTAEISIWNPSQDTVDKIRETVRTRIEWTPEERAELLAAGASAQPIEQTYDNFGMASVRLAWGYGAAAPGQPFPPLSVGFVGGSDKITDSFSGGGSRVLTLKCEDGAQVLGAGKSDKSYKGGTDTVIILRDLINALGLSVDEAKLRTSMQTAFIRRSIPVGKLSQAGPYSARGLPAAKLIGTIMDALQLRWSVQNGEFLLLDDTSVLAGYPPIILSAANGTLLGKPEPLGGGNYRARTWAHAEARPGREVLMQATGIDAQFRIDRTTDPGSTLSGGSTVVTLDQVQVIPGLF